MEIIANTTDFNFIEDTAVAIGKFDGVHMGHRRLVEELLAQKRKGLKTCVFTFDPTPAVLFGHSDGKELTTREEKRSIFRQLGVDILLEFPLTKDTADISPEKFVEEILVKGMHTAFVCAGTDLSFGRKGSGNAALLRKMSGELGFALKTIDKISLQGTEVSSTYIRGLVEAGRMREAQIFLGSPYTVMGTVVHGNKIGRTMGFPTVNLLPEENKLLPPNGVYYSKVRYQDKSYDAISNVGCKPTVSDIPVMGVETYLYDFTENIYDARIEVSLCDFKRPEQKFNSLEALKRQLQEDIREGQAYFTRQSQI